MVVVIRSLILVQEEAAFEAVQTDLSTSRDQRCQFLLMNLCEALFCNQIQDAFIPFSRVNFISFLSFPTYKMSHSRIFFALEV